MRKEDVIRRERFYKKTVGCLPLRRFQREDDKEP